MTTALVQLRNTRGQGELDPQSRAVRKYRFERTKRPCAVVPPTDIDQQPMVLSLRQRGAARVLSVFPAQRRKHHAPKSCFRFHRACRRHPRVLGRNGGAESREPGLDRANERGSAEGERVGHSVCMDAYGVYLRNSISPRMLIRGVADWVALACVAMALPN